MTENKPLPQTQVEHQKAKLIIFDLDGTLTPSKTDMDGEMAELIERLLEKKMVAVIGGGKYEQFQKQFLSVLSKTARKPEWEQVGKSAIHLPENSRAISRGSKVGRIADLPLKAPGDLLGNLFLFPTNGSTFYCYNGNIWEQVYAEKLSGEEKKRTFEAFAKTFQELNYHHPAKTYGEIIEDRNTQITFSALGQEAPLDLKLKWKEEHTAEKLKIAEHLQKYLPDLEVRPSAYTSIDVTHKGIDKAYGIKQIKKHLGIDFSEMLFVGDALFLGGNDSAALRTGVPCFEVKGPEETKDLIRSLFEN